MAAGVQRSGCGCHPLLLIYGSSLQLRVHVGSLACLPVVAAFWLTAYRYPETCRGRLEQGQDTLPDRTLLCVRTCPRRCMLQHPETVPVLQEFEMELQSCN